MTTEEKFKAAVNVIKGLPKDGPYQPTNEMKLTFYGLYKQATEGPCSEPKPSFYQVVAGYKWKAWSSFGDMSKEKAMETYVEELKKIVETMSYSSDVAKFMEVLGSFYEYVDIPCNNNGPVKKIDHKMGDISDDEEDNRQLPLTSAAAESHFMAIQSKSEEEQLEEFVVADKPIDSDLQKEKDEEREGEILVMKPMQNGHINGPIMANGILTKTHFMSPVEEDSKKLDASEQPLVASNGRQRLQSETDSEEEYSEPSESLLCYSNSADGFASPQFSVSSSHLQQMEETRLQQSTPTLRSPPQHQPLPPSAHLPLGGVVPVCREGPSAGGAGGDDMVLVLRQMQGDLQSMVQCLQAHLNDISQCLVALHNTTRALQAHSGASGGGSGHQSPSSGTEADSRRRRRQWWPFPELSPRSTFWLLLWPLLIHMGISGLKLLVKLRRRNQFLKIK